MAALAGAAAGAAIASSTAPQPCRPCSSGWRSVGGAAAGGSGRRSVAASAKRRIPKHTSSAGGGGRGRSAPKDKSAVRELSQALQGGRRRESSSNGGGGSGFGAKQERGGSRAGRKQRQEDEESEPGWDEELLADLSDSEVAELLGQEGEAEDVLAGADPQLRAAVEQVLAQFTFKLDPFQVQSVAHLLDGKSVVVCAPTGAGKTAIAEAATLHFLARGQRVIYTTPLKALSNQKLGEMRERFGHDGAGLQTGDASLNIDAPVVVMTTEILRNMLYRVGDEGATTDDRLKDVGLVVLDEVHYLGDPGRGSVWEEVIINLPPHIQILAMSATVRNPEDLGGWIGQVHGECETVRTSFRPVPLTWQFCHATLPPPAKRSGQRGGRGAGLLGSSDGDGSIGGGGGGGGSGAPSAASPGARLLPLLDPSGRRINPALLPPEKRFSEETFDDEWGRWDGLRRAKMRMRTVEELVGSLDGDEWHNLPRWKRIPSLEAVTHELHKAGMLPAIWFIFSRRECDLAARQLAMHGVQLASNEERQQIQAELDALAAEQPEAVRQGFAEPLLLGVASHHAGCLPAWKGLVERLFQRGLLKLVFATETLAAGINMPARTTLIAALSRRRDGGIGSLQHNELLQMAGRAGRRGYDTVGNCVILQSKWEDGDVAWDIVRRGPEPLRSQFTTGYSMVLNLLYTRTLEEARAFLDRSFAAYLGGQGVQRRLSEIERLEAKAATILDEVAQRTGVGAAAEALWAKYQKLLGRLKEEKRAAKLLRAQLAEERAATAELALERLDMPLLVGLDLSASNLGDSDYRLPALLLCNLEIGNGSGVWVVEAGPDYLCLGADNKLYQVGARHIAAIAEGPHPILEEPEAAEAVMRHAQALRSRSWSELSGDVGMAEGSVVTALIASKLLLPADLQAIVPSQAGLDALEAQRQRVRAVKAQVSEIKADRSFMKVSKAFNKQATKAAALMERAQTLRGELEEQTGGSWRAFEGCLSILQAAGALEPLAQQEGQGSEAAQQQQEQEQQQGQEQQEQQQGQEGAAAEVQAEQQGVTQQQAAAPLQPPAAEQAGEQPVEQQPAAEEQQPAPPAALDAAAAAADSVASSTEGGGAGSGTRVGFSALGLVAREVNCANELWMAVVLTHAAVQQLPPPQLAAVLSAVVAPESISRPAMWTAYSASEGATAAALALEDARQALAALQIQHGVEAPILVDLRLAGLVEAWASGCTWEELMTDCSLDDGDVARLLTRTVDLLRQVGYCDSLLPPLRRAARQAAAAMDRKPISDLVA